MIDPTFMIPDSIKQRFVDGLVEFLAQRAEQIGGAQAAKSIRKLSSDAKFLASADQAFEAGIKRFIAEYRDQDEDLVEAIRNDTIFWQAPEIQQALMEMVQHPGAWMPDESDTIARHFDWLFPQRLNRARVDKAVSHLLGCIAQELWGLPGAREVREVYALQFQKLTAEAARQQVALAKQQIEVTTQLSVDIRQALLQLTAAVEKNLLAPPAVPTLVASPRPYHNIPRPAWVRFVGREEEMAWLRRRLLPSDRAWQIAINGIGGVGKTALALAVADDYRARYHDLPPKERFDAIVWVSAKEEVLTAHGRERADLPGSVLHTLEDVYAAIARVLEREDITRAPSDEQNALVEKALQRQRTLLVMDNMESVQDDRIKAFLRNVPAPTKAIITSREWIDVADVRVLKGLTPEDAGKLMEEEVAIREVRLDPSQRQRLYDLTAGVPLPIKLGIARMAAGETFAAVTRWLGDAVGDLPEYCVKGQVELARRRDQGSWVVLLACSLFDREAGAAREALGKIADLNLADRDKALAELQKLFLVNRTEGDRFWVLPIVQRYAAAVLLGEPGGEAVIDRWLGWLADYVMPFTNVFLPDPKTINLSSIEYANLKSAIQWCYEHELWDRVLQLCRGICAYAYYSALFSDLDDILTVWLEAAERTNDQQSRGNALLQMARLAWIRRQSGEALRLLETTEEVLESSGEYVALAEAWDTRSQICENVGQREMAESYAQGILCLGQKLDDPFIRSQGAERLAAIYGNQGKYNESHKWLDQAEADARQTGLQRLVTIVNQRRAQNFVAEGEYGAAESLLLQCLRDDGELGGKRYVAYDKLHLATVYAATERLDAARQFAEDARDIFERIGMEHARTRAERFLENLASRQVDQNGL